jgi:hypothetical protein
MLRPAVPPLLGSVVQCWQGLLARAAQSPRAPADLLSPPRVSTGPQTQTLEERLDDHQPTRTWEQGEGHGRPEPGAR